MTDPLQKKDREFLWHPYSSLEQKHDNIVIASAKGLYLQTPDGRKIMDAISSWWVNLHGHAHPHIAEKIAQQAITLEHVIFAGFTHEPAVRLAERLLEILPGDQSRIFFSDNGSTAVEVALKMAIQSKINTGKTSGKILALEGAFHGDTFGAMSVSERGIFTRHFGKYLFEVEHIPFPDEENESACLEAFESRVKRGDIGAFIYEPLIQGAAGMRIYSARILNKLLALAAAYDVVLIADEVMTGFGRTGKLFASEYMSTPPDIICLSKGITGGFMPLGATSCNKKTESAFLFADSAKTLFHGHSYTANPLACAAANASLDLLTDEKCLRKIELINKNHLIFAEAITQYQSVKKVRVLGTILSIEIDTQDDTGYLNTIRDQLYYFFLDRNILLRPLGNVLYILPPYIITENELNEIYRSILDLLKKIPNQLP